MVRVARCVAAWHREAGKRSMMEEVEGVLDEVSKGMVQVQSQLLREGAARLLRRSLGGLARGTLVGRIQAWRLCAVRCQGEAAQAQTKGDHERHVLELCAAVDARERRADAVGALGTLALRWIPRDAHRLHRCLRAWAEERRDVPPLSLIHI